MIADGGSATDENTGMDHARLTDTSIGVDDRVGPDRRVRAYPGRLVHHSRRVNARIGL